MLNYILMAIYLYLRVSTSHQSFEQQMQDVHTYFDTHNIRMEDVTDIVEEHESGGTSFVDRKFQTLLSRCIAGDIIYAASTDRLGRSFVDMVRMMDAARARGITIVACKQGLSLADDSMATKIILSITAIIDEDERQRIRHRTRNGVGAARQELRTYGHRVTRQGNVQTHWGNPKGTDLSHALEASIKAKQDDAIAWRQSSAAYQWVREKFLAGTPRKQMVAELQSLYNHAPEKFCNRQGQPVTASVVYRWCAELSQSLPAV